MLRPIRGAVAASRGGAVRVAGLALATVIAGLTRCTVHNAVAAA